MGRFALSAALTRTVARASILRCGGTGSGHQADDRQFPVGLVLETGEAVRGGGDLLPRLRALSSVKLFGGHRDRAAVDLDMDFVGVGGDVLVVAEWNPQARQVIDRTWLFRPSALALGNGTPKSGLNALSEALAPCDR